jgi:hypothetical protein
VGSGIHRLDLGAMFCNMFMNWADMAGNGFVSVCEKLCELIKNNTKCTRGG